MERPERGGGFRLGKPSVSDQRAKGIVIGTAAKDSSGLDLVDPTVQTQAAGGNGGRDSLRRARRQIQP